MKEFIPLSIFYSFGSILLFSAVMVVSSRHPVRAVLYLVLTFFCSAVLWLLLQAEFLALVLIFVYVGAVMTLFLFVVMMLNLDTAPRQRGWVNYLPLGLVVMGLLAIVLWRIVRTGLFSSSVEVVVPSTSHTAQLGAILYTDYGYPFELAAVLLLVSIVAVIALDFRGVKSGKFQRISEQLAVRREDRVTLVKMVSENRTTDIPVGEE